MCPYQLLRDPRWQFIVQTYIAAQIAPLAGWPDKYLAWVQGGLMLIEQAKAERTAEALSGN